MLGPSDNPRAFARLQLTAALVLLAGAAHAQTPLAIPRERVLALDMLLDATNPIVKPSSNGPPGTVWQENVRSRVASGGLVDPIRVHVRMNQPAGSWSLRILDATGTEIDQVTSEEWGNRREFWSRQVDRSPATLEMRRTASGATPEVTIDYAYQVIPTIQQAITEPNDLQSISTAPLRIRRLGKPVARLRFIIPGEGQSTCTAFLVGTRLLLTNQHCITSVAEMESALVDFNFDSPDSAAGGLRVSAIEATSVDLDYTLLRLSVDPPSGAGRLYFAPLDEARRDEQPLVILQHPSGLPKHVSMTGCRIDGLDLVGVSVRTSDFGHVCDTLGGSSGSPVLDWDTGRVVGLHHFGFLPGVKKPVNQAVARELILDDIKQQNAAAHAEMLQAPP